MNANIKSGQEILDDFFDDLMTIDGVDRDIAEMIVRLYKDGKLTNTNITNELERMREQKRR
jgi:hypothetical protein